MISHLYLFLLLPFFTFFLFAPINKEKKNKSDTTNAIDETYLQFSEAWADLNADAVASTWTEDASFITPDANTDIIRGREKIREMYSSRFEQARSNGVQTSISFFISERVIEGNIATDMGYARSVTLSEENEETVSFMKMVIVLKRDEQDGKWRFHIDSFSDSSQEEFDNMKSAREITF
jgi:uncharacterized protein (TIGR02246 family)